MLNNLRAEMVRHGVSVTDIAKEIGRSDRTVRDKIKGKGEFSMPEAEAIRNAFFPEMSLEYLFARDANQTNT